MRVVFMGTPEFAVPSLEALARAGHDLVAVVTRPDRPRRHGGAAPEPSAVKVAAARLGVPVHQPESARDPGLESAVSTAAPDVVVVVAYGAILPASVLGIPRHGCINLHASLLPRHRGAAPIARALMAGDEVTGVTTMLMERGLDTGPILLQRECATTPEETAGELTSRLGALGAALLVETLAAVESGEVTPRRQPEAAATWAPPLRREDATIDWGQTAAIVAGRVRGCNPWPVAETFLGRGRVQILRAVSEPETIPARGGEPPAPGTVVEAAGDRIVVACGAGTLLRVLEIRRPGRRAQAARDALNGRLVRRGDRFAAAPSQRGSP
jgi:methionyl-tRNA formyltransferase